MVTHPCSGISIDALLTQDFLRAGDNSIDRRAACIRGGGIGCQLNEVYGRQVRSGWSRCSKNFIDLLIAIICYDRQLSS
ncbi:MAG: hypothetical protein ACXVX6_06565 [Mycobacterium sp.]